MKVIKNILLFCFLLFGIIMQTEIFQNELWNFETAYFQASRFEVLSEELSLFIEDASIAASDNNAHIFSYYMEKNSNYRRILHIFGNDDAIRQTILDTANVDEKEYTSLISGITAVKYHELSDMDNTLAGYEPVLCYIGNEEAVNGIYGALASTYNISYPAFLEASEKDMIVIVWGMIAILMVVLNSIEAIRCKKEVVVKVSLGVSVKRIILKTMAIDAAADIFLFAAARFVLSYFVSGLYEDGLVIAIYCIGIICSLLPYLSFCAFDIRKAFANAEQHKGAMILLYALQFVACVITIFTISTNVSNMKGNLFANAELLEPYYNSYYATVRSANYDPECESRFWKEIFINEYDTVKPTICIRVHDGKNDCVFVNCYADGMLQDFASIVQGARKEEPDVIMLIPKDRSSETNKQIAYEQLGFVFGCSDSELANLQIEYIDYSQTEEFSYLTANTADGIETTTNPIIIYQANKEVLLNTDILSIYEAGSRIFQCDKDTLYSVFQDYASQQERYEIVTTNVYDQYSYSHSFMVKLISFLSTLCVVVLFLDVAIILSITRLEFRQNAMKISLMRILGYDLYNRHKEFVSIMTIENAVIFIGLLIYAVLTHRIGIGTVTGVSTVVMLIEYIIILLNIIAVERTNVQKSLKGGCL